MLGLFLDDLVQVCHGAALDASGGIFLDELLADGLIKSLSKLADKLLGFVELVLGQKLTEAAAHVVDTLAYELVATGANDALAQGLFSILEIWHRVIRVLPLTPSSFEEGEREQNRVIKVAEE